MGKQFITNKGKFLSEIIESILVLKGGNIPAHFHSHIRHCFAEFFCPVTIGDYNRFP